MTVAVSRAPAGLVGREAELGVLFDFVDGVRERDGARTLVVRGEPGIGKTSLLFAARSRAGVQGVRALRTAGVQSEVDLPYSGLHQLLLPLLANRLEHLPERQRDALRGAFGLGVEAAPDRFLVGLAVLTLLSEEAEGSPLLCLVDDAHWLDQPSAQALAFMVRRLSAESVVVVFAASEPRDELRGLPDLVVEGLNDADARELLGSVVPGRLDERVRERILAEAGGNPLALLELPRRLSPAQLAGGFGLEAVMSDAGSVAGRIQESFLRRLETLPAETQLLLLVAASEPVGDPALLWRAAERLGIGHEALSPATAAELLEVGIRVRFRHPLVRSAVYGAASPEERRTVHHALADATDANVDRDRRAWHRGCAASGPDEEVAAELEQSAARAQARAGLAAAAAFLERAVALTVDPALRTRRALVAAQAKFEAAAPDAAVELLATAEMGVCDALQRARLERLRAQIAFARTGSADVPGLKLGPEAPALLLDAAKRLEPLDVELARETYLEAITAAMCTGSTSGEFGVRAVAEAARQATPAPKPRPIDLLLDSLVTRFTEPYSVALPPLRQALHALARSDVRGEDNARWMWFACPIAPEPLALDLWDDEKWHELATRAVRICRDAGALTVLPQALTYRASMHVLAGEFAAASALIDEAYAIAEATGNVPLRYPSMLLAVWRGDEAAALSVLAAATEDARARGLERSIGMAQCLTALLYNGLGRYQDALAAAQRAHSYFPTDELDDLGPPGWALVELIEAGVRSDRRNVASDALRQLAERTQASATDWALGIEARSRALLSAGETAEHLYQEAIERLGRTRIRVELPRARLYYGEWLRREQRRRVDAREQLRLAYDAFALMGAQAFAERARRELVSTGEKPRRRRDETRDQLTAQEAQIARLARDGLTNPEIAAQLFLSTRTVEWHLHKVFSKLGIRSRTALHAALPGKDREAAPA